MKKLINKGVKFWESEISLRILFFSIIILNFVLIPYMEGEKEGSIIVKSFFLFIVVSGSVALIKNNRTKYSVYTFCFISFVVWLFGRNNNILWLDVFDSLLQCLFLLLFIVLILIRVFQGGVFTIQRLEGAMAGYLLFGNFFAVLFYALNMIHGANTFSVPGGENIAAFTYFSFTTLTTTGYGDILPVHHAVRAISNMEAVIGQLYPAVLIARLISLDKPKDA